MSDLNIIILVLRQSFKKPNRDDIINNLQAIKQNLSFCANTICFDTEKTIDVICKLKTNNRIANVLERISNSIDREINRVLEKEFKKN